MFTKKTNARFVTSVTKYQTVSCDRFSARTHAHHTAVFVRFAKFQFTPAHVRLSFIAKYNSNPNFALYAYYTLLF